jgi:hypothetical protein
MGSAQIDPPAVALLVETLKANPWNHVASEGNCSCKDILMSTVLDMFVIKLYITDSHHTLGERLHSVIEQVDGVRLQEVAEALIELPKGALLSTHLLPGLPVCWDVPQVHCTSGNTKHS